jgi:hypothetical protein
VEVRAELESLGIFPEESAMPFHTDSPIIESPLVASPYPEKLTMMNRILAVLGLIGFALSAVSWLDRYVVQIYP